jgi:hypothetical protein
VLAGMTPEWVKIPKTKLQKIHNAQIVTIAYYLQLSIMILVNGCQPLFV